MKRFAATALMAFGLSACVATPAPSQASSDPTAPAVVLPSGVTMKEANWYSEQVRVSGRLFLPAGPSDGAARPAVVLAPDWRKTAETLDAYAAELAANGIVALSVDYRGWGRSGAELFLGERVDTYDKMRFSQHTPDIVFRRGRLDPEHQVQDLRNAITFIQSEPGVDRARIGILGVGLGGGHVVSVMGMDVRAKAGVGVTPDIPGQGEPEKSLVPDAATQSEMIKLAREGAPPRAEAAARVRNVQEGRLALAEYKPFWRLDAIPNANALMFVIAGKDTEVDNRTNAIAAGAAHGANSAVRTLFDADHALTPAEQAEAARLAAEWMKSQLAS